jgi:heat shock protein HslJ
MSSGDVSNPVDTTLEETSCRGALAHSRRAAVVGIVALMLMASCGEGTSGLVGPTWRWTNLTENAPLAHSEVSDPGLYTLTLADDGSFRVRADCNTALGTYVTDGDEITLSLGPATLAACPEGSLADPFVSLLDTVSTFGVEGNDLALHLANAAGTMTFEAAS